MKTKAIEIPENEITYYYRRRTDDLGVVFCWNEKIYRGIHPESIQQAEELISSGLLSALNEANLIPKTTITKLTSKNFPLIFSHEKVWGSLHPGELTFNMLKNAALTVLKVAKIADSYNYDMKDCHLQNIMFSGGEPKYVDIGSFVKRKSGSNGWTAKQEFHETYTYPLKIWSMGFDGCARLHIASSMSPKFSLYALLTNKLAALIPCLLLDSFYSLVKNVFKIQTISFQELEKYNSKPYFWALKSAKQLLKLLLSANTNFDTLIKSTKKIRRKPIQTSWSGYHNNCDMDNVRFKTVVSHIKSQCSDAVTLVDIAGNQGILSLKIISETQIKQAICLDYDEAAIDSGYSINHKNKSLLYACTDFMSPYGLLNDLHPYERFYSDIVVCMAISHHLILGQGYSPELIVMNLGKICKKYLFIEFMPKGLWHGSNENFNIPEFYNLDCFRESLEKLFTVLSIEAIADNRVLIFCVKNNPR